MSSTNGSPQAERAGPQVLLPGWAPSPGVRGLVTLRSGGFSAGPWGLAGGARGGWNLGAHCGDAPADVARNRALLRGLLPAEPVWLEQVHGCAVHVVCPPDGTAQQSGPAGMAADAAPRAAGDASPAAGAVPPIAAAAAAAAADADADADADAERPVADAAVTAQRGVVLAVLTADCLPVLLTDAAGSAVGVAHAGWRGLAAGVLERTVQALAGLAQDRRLIAWLGPAIGQARFEVGDEVREAFVCADPGAAEAFAAGAAPGKWQADLYRLARRRLAACGVASIHGGDHCTASEPQRFWSYRRDRVTGRMASLIWLDP